MNVCIISGTVQRNAIVRGKKNKALVFTVVTQQQPNGDSETAPNFVPCVIWNPPDDLAERLTSEGEGLQIELQGRVNSSRHENNGEPRSNAEVVVYTRSVKLQ